MRFLSSALPSGLLVVLALVLAGCAGGPDGSDAVRVASPDATPATATYEGALPPLLDRQVFFDDAQYANAQLSPAGTHVSFTKPYQGVRNVWVKETGAPLDAATPVTADTTRPVRTYTWTRDGDRILYEGSAPKGDVHVYAVDPIADTTTAPGVPSATDLTPGTNVQARIRALPEATPNAVVVSQAATDAQRQDLYRIDLADGTRTRIFENTGGYSGFTFGREGRLRLARRQAPDRSVTIRRVERTEQDTSFTTLYSCSTDEACGVVRFHKDNERVYLRTNRGPDVDRQRLVLLDVQTAETTPVASDPEEQVDFESAVFNNRTGTLAATVYVGARQRVYPQTDAFADLYETLRDALPNGELSLVSSTADYQTHLVKVRRDVDPGTVYRFDAETGAVEKLYESRPELPSGALASMRPITYEARDGQRIPAYLTVPRGVEAQDLPPVVLVHGGPWSRDTWGYDAFAQFLANRGYAVLQANFRGSRGFGQAYLHAGDQSWGTGTMQHDLTDGVKHLIETGVADPDRVGIFGGSYGGYASLAGATFTPDLYAAAVPYVAPSNLFTLLQAFPDYMTPYLEKSWYRRVGDPNNDDDRARLKKQSPLFHLDQIDTPLLVLHGGKDPRVKQREADRLVTTLRDNDVPVRYLVAPNEGHGFRRPANRLASAAAMEAFLAEHLGGRAQTTLSDRVGDRLEALTVNPDSVTSPSVNDVRRVDGSVLTPATHAYDISLSIGDRSIDLSTTQTLRRTTTDGTETWTLLKKTETPGGTVTDSLVADRTTLLPRSRHQRGPFTLDVAYTDSSARGEVTTQNGTRPITAAFDTPTLAGGSHDRLALSSMPLAPGFSATLQSFSPRNGSIKTTHYEVTGTAGLGTPAGGFDTYVVKVRVDGGNATGTLHVRRTAPHYVVKSALKLSTPRGTRTLTQTLTSLDPDDE
jgi:dipeptidyl aminopeptidase/acylaminoacyl peptidase